MQKFNVTTRKVLDCKILERLLDICLWEEERACIADAQNHVRHDLSRHTILEYQLPVDNWKKGNVCLLYDQTGDMVPDILTINMTAKRFSNLMLLTGGS